MPVDPSREISQEPQRSHGKGSGLPLSPRRRRLRRTLGIVLIVSLAGLAGGLFSYYQTRPKQYHPDEKLVDITSSLERNLPRGAPKPAFRDVTSQAGLASFRTFAGTRTSQLPEDMGAGVAWGDFNNDGFDDVFLVSAGGPLNAPDDKLAPCELYENLGNGTFRKVAGFPETRIHGMAAAWADYDGDGYLDLIVTGYNPLCCFATSKARANSLVITAFRTCRAFGPAPPGAITIMIGGLIFMCVVMCNTPAPRRNAAVSRRRSITVP